MTGTRGAGGRWYLGRRWGIGVDWGWFGDFAGGDGCVYGMDSGSEGIDALTWIWGS
jgi:hypothetical protein